MDDSTPVTMRFCESQHKHSALWFSVIWGVITLLAASIGVVGGVSWSAAYGVANIHAIMTEREKATLLQAEAFRARLDTIDQKLDRLLTQPSSAPLRGPP